MLTLYFCAYLVDFVFTFILLYISRDVMIYINFTYGRKSLGKSNAMENLPKKELLMCSLQH